MGNKIGKQRNIAKGKESPLDGSFRTNNGGKNKFVRKNTDDQIQRIIQKGKVEQFYDVNNKHVLGRGHYASVCLAVNKSTGQKVALKKIRIQKSHVSYFSELFTEYYDPINPSSFR